MKKLLLLLLITVSTFGQVGINTSSPQAVFDIYSTTSGILIPRLTTAQKNSIQSPVISMLVFDSDLNEFNYYNGTNWIGFSTGYIPTSGTTEPISGDLEFSQGSKLKFKDLDNNERVFVGFNPENDETGVWYKSETNENTMLAFWSGGATFWSPSGANFNFTNEYFSVMANGTNGFKGIFGQENYSDVDPTNKNIYTQRSYVDNQNGKLQQLSTTEISAITTPEIGKLYYNTTSKEIVFYNGVEWRKISNSGM